MTYLPLKIVKGAISLCSVLLSEFSYHMINRNLEIKFINLFIYLLHSLLRECIGLRAFVVYLFARDLIRSWISELKEKLLLTYFIWSLHYVQLVSWMLFSVLPFQMCMSLASVLPWIPVSGSLHLMTSAKRCSSLRAGITPSRCTSEPRRVFASYKLLIFITL